MSIKRERWWYQNEGDGGNGGNDGKGNVFLWGFLLFYTYRLIIKITHEDGTMQYEFRRGSLRWESKTFKKVKRECLNIYEEEDVICNFFLFFFFFFFSTTWNIIFFYSFLLFFSCNAMQTNHENEKAYSIKRY